MASLKKCKINIDSYRCKGCAACPEFCPEVFKMNETTEKAELVVMDEYIELTESLEQAVAVCPTACIEIEC